MGLGAVAALWLRREVPPPLVLPEAPERLDPAVRRQVEEAAAEAAAEPRSGSLRGKLGLVYEANYLWPEARETFAQAAELAPEEMLWRFHLAVASRQAGDPEAALEILRVLVREHPGFAPASQRLGIALLEAGEPGAALKAFEAVIRSRPEVSDGYRGAGEALLQLDRAAEAAARLEEALRRDPGDRGARYRLGVAYQRLGRSGEAGELLASGLDTERRLLPGPLERQLRGYAVSLPARFARAESLHRRGRPREAAELLEEALPDHPGSLTLRNNLASAWLDAGRAGRSRELLEEALELDPESVDTWINLSRVALVERRGEEALRLADAAVQRSAETAAAHSARAQALVQLRRYPEARESMERARRLDPADPGLALGLGVLYEVLNLPGEALALYREAVDRWPDLLPAWIGLGKTAHSLDRVREARQALAAARRLQPGDPEVEALARRLGKSGK